MLAPAPRADLRTLRPAPPLSPRSARTHPSPRPSRVSSAGPSVGCVVPSCSPQRPRGTSLPRGKQAGRRRAGRHCMSETPIEAKPFTAHLAANSDPPRGKQRPTDLARSALVSRSLRARCALRAPRAARSGRLSRPVNRLADWENGSTDYLIIFRFGCAAALHNQSSRWIFLPSAASLSIYRLRTGSYLDRIWF